MIYMNFNINEFKKVFSFLEAQGSFIDFIDKDGYYIYSSEYCQQLAGVSQEEIVGKHILDVYGKDALLYKSVSTGKIYRNTISIYTSGAGIEYCYLFDCQPVYIDNEYIGIFGISKTFGDLKTTLKILEKTPPSHLKVAHSKKKRMITFEDIISVSSSMQESIEIAKKAALNTSSVLIVGETGTGKELFAQSIHNYSCFSEGPFVAVNCSAIPDSLIESTLFGTTKGSYTGAVDKRGLFEESNNGTLFLDELNSMNIDMQAKILRAIQTRTVRRIGSEKEIDINSRIITAINVNPFACIEQRKLRADLFYRLAAVSIEIKPLRHRKEDILPLTDFFIQKYNIMYNKEIQGISKTVSNFFYQYSWPGNVRELEHMLEHAMNMVNPDEFLIQKRHLPLYFTNQTSGVRTQYDTKDFKKAREQALTEAETEFTDTFISDALRKHHGNITQAAQELNISRQYLHSIIKKYKINII